MAIPSRRDQICLLASLLLHSLVFLSLVLGGGGGSGGAGDNPGAGEIRYKGVDVGNVIPKEKIDVDIVETPVQKSEIVLKKQKPKRKKVINAEKECPGKWYGGIGIRNGVDPVFRCDRVVEVFQGYAADLAGLQVGDLILWTSDGEIVGPPGTVFQMKIMRGGEILVLTITRVKVCY